MSNRPTLVSLKVEKCIIISWAFFNVRLNKVFRTVESNDHVQMFLLWFQVFQHCNFLNHSFTTIHQSLLDFIEIMANEECAFKHWIKTFVQQSNCFIIVYLLNNTFLNNFFNIFFRVFYLVTLCFTINLELKSNFIFKN
jgi:hypothetical protein